MPTIKNLGLVKGIHVDTAAPSNTNLLWKDTGNNGAMKYYDTNLAAWLPTSQPPRFASDAAAEAAGLIAGSIYYNTATQKLRGKENATWSNLI